jgi:hypothetical protein
MTPKEKAKELIDKMTTEIGKFNAKQCALVAVNELINSIPCIPSPILNENITDSIMQAREYWKEVKNEIDKL